MPNYTEQAQGDGEHFPFLDTENSERKRWKDVLKEHPPTIDHNGYLSGEWGRCVVAAVRYEHSHPDWSEYPEYADNGPAGWVVEYMNFLNFGGEYCDASDKLENATHEKLNEGKFDEGLSPGPDDPQVWKTPLCDPAGYQEQVAVTMSKTCWCCLCLCCGAGFGECADPLCLSSAKCMCSECATYTEDCWGDYGPCFSFQKFLCCVSHQTLWPGGGPADGVPCCACCNFRCGSDEGEDGHPKQNTNAKIMENAFLCYTCLCCSCGLSMRFPLIKGDSKCCCVRTFTSTASCCPEDRGICYKYEKTCCCIEVCTFPCGGGAHDGIPKCACCGKSCGDDDIESGSESS